VKDRYGYFERDQNVYLPINTALDSNLYGVFGLKRGFEGDDLE